MTCPRSSHAVSSAILNCGSVSVRVCDSTFSVLKAATWIRRLSHSGLSLLTSAIGVPYNDVVTSASALAPRFLAVQLLGNVHGGQRRRLHLALFVVSGRGQTADPENDPES